MNEWLNLFQRHRASDPCDGCEMVFGEAADAGKIDELERKFGFRFPAEFWSLYTTYDGYGVTFDNKPGEIYWDFRPLGDLELFVKQYHDAIVETHPSVATSFYPFFDWSTGDSAGYLLDDNGQPLPGLYDFYHAGYEADPTQDFTDFLEKASDTIVSYIEKMISECENA